MSTWTLVMIFSWAIGSGSVAHSGVVVSGLYTYGDCQALIRELAYGSKAVCVQTRQ